jgi:hypothetical protein
MMINTILKLSAIPPTSHGMIKPGQPHWNWYMSHTSELSFLQSIPDAGERGAQIGNLWGVATFSFFSLAGISLGKLNRRY